MDGHGYPPPMDDDQTAGRTGHDDEDHLDPEPLDPEPLAMEVEDIPKVFPQGEPPVPPSEADAPAP